MKERADRDTQKKHTEIERDTEREHLRVSNSENRNWKSFLFDNPNRFQIED